MVPLINILLLEDDPADAKLIEANLADAGLACRITIVRTADAFEAALRNGGMDIILADYRLPTYDGMSALRMAQEVCPDLPFIFVSGTRGEEAVIAALTGGAFDYVLKKNVSRLGSAVQRALHEAGNLREHRQAQEALQRSYDALRAIIEAAPIPIYGLDLDGRVQTVWNPAAEKMLGWSAKEVMGKPLPTVPADRKEECKRLREQIRSGITLDGVEVHRQRRNGTPIDYCIYASPLHDTQGRINGNIALLVDVTERKRTEMRLNEQLLFLQQLLDSIPIPVYYKDAEGSYLGCNTAFEAYLGLLKREIVGKTVHQLIPKERADKHHEMDLELLLQPGVQTYEVNGIYKDGKHHDVVFHKATFVDANGSAVGTVGTLEDITERKQAENKLIESEERYRSLFEQVPVALYRTTLAGQFLDVNLANIRMLGFPDRDTLLKVNAAELYPNPEERKQWRAIAERDGIVRDFDMQLQRSDGKVIWVRNTGRAVRDSDGKALYYEGHLEDITERKKAEESIRKLSQAIEQSPVSIVITDLSGRIEFVNAKFTQVTGYAYDEALGKNPRILKSGETPKDEYRRLWQTIESGNVWQGEFQNRKKNGELFWEQATVAPVRNADNVITHYVAVKEDITERKRLEEQLRQTQKMEAVGQLAGGVAHDFNNMLSVIIGHAELALDGSDLDDSLRKNLQEILAAGLRSSDITRQLLAFARKQTIVPRILDLNEAVEGMLKLLRRLIGEDIDLAWMPGAKLWPVKMDPSQIDQVLANLCINARDAIAGVGRISIETQRAVFDDAYCAEHRGFSPGEYVILAVSDNGSGMDKGTMEKIFEPFFTTKGMGKGTGMGLATVYGIVKQNHGFINVYSEPGSGTTFKIYMPRHAAPSSQEPEAISDLPDLSGHETILVVEDEILNLELVELMLKTYGYQVLVASYPSEALHTAKRHTGKIHLLLTDLIMPEMNGRDLSKELISLYPDIKCLFMSGYTNDIIVHQGILDQGIHFIQKPFSMQDLAGKVREVLDAG